MERKEIIIYVVELSRIKNFMLLDIGVGTASYYLIRLLNGNIIIDIVGSVLITEGAKRFYRKRGRTAS